MHFLKIDFYFKEKSYFVEEISQHSKSNDCTHIDWINQHILKAFAKCLEDYQGEIKHTKMIFKEVLL